MTDRDALMAFHCGKTLDQETTKRLWQLGYLEVADVTDHDTRPSGTRELMGTLITPKGRRLIEGRE